MVVQWEAFVIEMMMTTTVVVVKTTDLQEQMQQIAGEARKSFSPAVVAVVLAAGGLYIGAFPLGKPCRLATSMIQYLHTMPVVDT